MPGATRDARWASTASLIDDVMQNRSPNVSDGPLDDRLGGRQLELRAGDRGQLLQLVAGPHPWLGGGERHEELLDWWVLDWWLSTPDVEP